LFFFFSNVNSWLFLGAKDLAELVAGSSALYPIKFVVLSLPGAFRLTVRMAPRDSLIGWGDLFSITD